MKTPITWYKSPILLFQILTHLSVIPMIIYGTITDWLVALVAYFLIGGWGIAIVYHRYISHKSFEAPAWFIKIGTILGILGGVGSPIQWVCQHREHHAFADTDRDPHRPGGSIKNFLFMHFFPMLLPASPKFAVDLLRDPVQKKIHDRYWLVHLAYVIILLCIDPFAIVYAYLFPNFLLWHAIASLGTFAHIRLFGTRPCTTRDDSGNMWLLAWLAFGEGWHNNHHAVASDWRFGRKWYQVDLSAFIIKLVKTK